MPITQSQPGELEDDNPIMLTTSSLARFTADADTLPLLRLDVVSAFMAPPLGSQVVPAHHRDDEMMETLLAATDKYEADIALQPEAAYPTSAFLAPSLHSSAVPELPPGKSYRILLSPMQPVHLNAKTMRRILAMRKTIFKYGIYLPKTDRDADTSPESARWRSGRQFE